MALWVVRAGSKGVVEDFVLSRGIAAIGWEEVGDLSRFTGREELRTHLAQVYPGASPNRLHTWAAQLWAFAKEMKEGDLVALPSKFRPVIHFGRVKGPYHFEPGNPFLAKHTRPVEWFAEVPRERFDPELLYSFGSTLTVFRVRRNDAENRVGQILQGVPPAPSEGEEGEGLYLEALALEGIRQHVGRRFRGHALARLVEGILRAQGYQTWRAPEGPDGGVDILAGAGPLGLDAPRLVVQVKSGDAPLDVKELREFLTVVSRFSRSHLSAQGLLVAWGGFKGTVRKEHLPDYFQVHLWTGDDLLQALLEHYDRLPAELQAEIPLKRIWTLIPEEG